MILLSLRGGFSKSQLLLFLGVCLPGASSVPTIIIGVLYYLIEPVDITLVIFKYGCAGLPRETYQSGEAKHIIKVAL
jgi:hypothetical protein